MTFGSFGSGIRQVQLSWPSGLRSDPAAVPLRLVDRRTPPNAVEVATTVRHGGWYYLVVSFALCCRALTSTHNINVGRSRSVSGPYFDRRGMPLPNGGETKILATDGREIGPGGESAARGHLVHHFYDGDAGGATPLGIRKIVWAADGWPKL
jgi:arabinan endo-1,5-alpha-L-arabinosidase